MMRHWKHDEKAELTIIKRHLIYISLKDIILIKQIDLVKNIPARALLYINVIVLLQNYIKPIDLDDYWLYLYIAY